MFHRCFISRQLIYNYPEQMFTDAGVMAIEHADFEGVERLVRIHTYLSKEHRTNIATLICCTHHLTHSLLVFLSPLIGFGVRCRNRIDIRTS